MLKKLNELRSQRENKIQKMRELLNLAETEKRSLSKEESSEFDELRSESEELKAQISRFESIVSEERSNVLETGDRLNNNEVPSNEELRHYVLTGEARSLSTASEQDGGYTVIPELDRQVMRRLKDESDMRSICTVKRTSTKTYEKLVSLGGATTGRGEEGKARKETTTPKLTKLSISLSPIYAYPKTTQEILDFSDIDILDWLTDEVSDAFVETEDNDFVLGTGSGQAKGFAVYPRAIDDDKARALGTLQKIVAASESEIKADELIDLYFSLKKKYRKNAVWTMTSKTAGALNKLKNENGDYIWRDGMKSGEPDTLLGKPVKYLEDMDEIGAGSAPIAFGDFKRGYYIIDHTVGVRTRPDNITEPGFYKVHTDKYLGGGVVDSNAIKFLEMKPAK